RQTIVGPSFRMREFPVISIEITDDKEFLLPAPALIYIEFFVIRQKEFVYSAYDHFICLSQTDQFFVIIEHSICSSHLLRCVDLRIVRIYHDPRSACCESCILTVIPLERRPCVIPALVAEVTHHLFLSEYSLSYKLMVGI